MSRVETTIQIGRPVERVFEFVTTPGNWPKWHPSSLGVSGAVDHSLEVGEQVTEDFRVAGRLGRAVWTVREREAPKRWVIDGEAENGNRATITYTLTPTTDGTSFHRELVYSVLDARLEWAKMHPVVEAESAEALRRLKEVLESDAG